MNKNNGSAVTENKEPLFVSAWPKGARSGSIEEIIYFLREILQQELLSNGCNESAKRVLSELAETAETGVFSLMTGMEALGSMVEIYPQSQFRGLESIGDLIGEMARITKALSELRVHICPSEIEALMVIRESGKRGKGANHESRS